jgi:hypothetical protein
VVEEALNARVLVFTGGLEDQPSIVATDGTMTDGSGPEPFGGLTIINVPSREDALAWAARIAVACRCAQEVREFMPIPNPNTTRCTGGADSRSIPRPAPQRPTNTTGPNENDP